MPTSLSNKKSIRVSAPGRANLIGEHIDYAGGVVLPFAISNRTFVTISVSGNNIVTVQSSQTGTPVSPSMDEIELWPEKNWARYPLGVIHVLNKKGFSIPGLSIEINGNVPHGAGLSSSASLECAVAFGINELLSLGLTHLELAKISQQAENEYVGMPCGLMDQATSMLARELSLIHI